MATLTSFCSSSLTTTLSHHKHTPKAPFLSKTHLTFLSLTPSFSPNSLTSSSPRAPTLSFVPKLAQTESPVVEAELESETEISPLEEVVSEEPKREEVFAVVMIGGRQYIVFPGRFLYTQRFKGANVNDKVVLNQVLLVGTKTTTYLGRPLVPNAAVHAVVEEHGLNDKVRVFKYKKKKGYRRNIGHRQPNTRIRIMAIAGYENAPGFENPQ